MLATLAIILWAIETSDCDYFKRHYRLFRNGANYCENVSGPDIRALPLWVFYVIGVTLELATTQFTAYNLIFPVYTVIGSAIIMVLTPE